MNIAICDDEKYICDSLQRLISMEDPEASVTLFDSADALMDSRLNFQILFLDIQMPGISGIDAARKVREKNSDVIIIFITALKEYVFEAFDVSAFNYLLKPVNEKKFAAVYKSARKKCEKKLPLVIKTGSNTHTIPQENILYIESQIKKQVIHTKSCDLTCYEKLKDLAKQLGYSFYRCHRGYLVNMAYICGYSADAIELAGGMRVYMAKERYADFKKCYMKYLKDGGDVYV